MQATIYIRKENEARWEKLDKNKSKFVNDALANGRGNWVLVDSPRLPKLQIDTTRVTATPTIIPQSTPVKGDEFKFPPSAASMLDK